MTQRLEQQVSEIFAEEDVPVQRGRWSNGKLVKEVLREFRRAENAAGWQSRLQSGYRVSYTETLEEHLGYLREARALDCSPEKEQLLVEFAEQYASWRSLYERKSREARDVLGYFGSFEYLFGGLFFAGVVIGGAAAAAISGIGGNPAWWTGLGAYEALVCGWPALAYGVRSAKTATDRSRHLGAMRSELVTKLERLDARGKP